MPNSTLINMNLDGRPANYYPNKHAAARLGFDEQEVQVLGLFQFMDGDEADAYFVVELVDGRTCYAGVTEIQFTDTGARAHFGRRPSE